MSRKPVTQNPAPGFPLYNIEYMIARIWQLRLIGTPEYAHFPLFKELQAFNLPRFGRNRVRLSGTDHYVA